ncbi:MAG: hypothetical protein V7739_12705 [Motiliproteus sp.]
MAKLRRDTTPEENYSPLDAGWDDRLEGKRLNANPYAINNWKHYEWEKGWTLADEDAEGGAACDENHEAGK